MKNETVLFALNSVLEPEGFRRSGQRFVRSISDVVHIVAIQGSQTGTATTSRITLNLAVWAPSLADACEKPDVSTSHWRQRIGMLLPSKSDAWWDISSEEDARAVAAELTTSIRNFGLPALNSLSSTDALRILWEDGNSPGLTGVQRKRFLETLNSEKKKMSLTKRWSQLR